MQVRLAGRESGSSPAGSRGAEYGRSVGALAPITAMIKTQL